MAKFFATLSTSFVLSTLTLQLTLDFANGLTKQEIETNWGENEFDKLPYVYWTIPNEMVDKQTGEPTLKPTIVPVEGFDVEKQTKRIITLLNPIDQNSKKYADQRVQAVRLLTAISPDQRQQIATIFKQRLREFTRNASDLMLDKFLEKKYMDHSEKFILAVVQAPEVLDCQYIKASLSGLVKDKKDLNEIATTRSNKQLKELQRVCTQQFPKGLIKAIEDGISSVAKSAKDKAKKIQGVTGDTNPYVVLLKTIFNGERDEYNMYPGEKVNNEPAFNNHLANTSLVEEDADSLQDTIAPEEYNRILGGRSYLHISAIMAEFKSRGTSLIEVIKKNKKHFDSNYLDLLITIARVVENMPRFFADRFNEAMKTVGNFFKGGLDDDDFIRYVVSRSPVDLAATIQEYATAYGKNDIQALLKAACKKSEIKGNKPYLEGVIILLQGNFGNILPLPKECQ